MKAAALVLLGAAFALAGCKGPPPQREIDAAARQVQEARDAGAAELAPDALQDADQALARARQKVDEGDYRAALSETAEAGESARAALQAARLAREQERRRAEDARREAESALGEAAAVREAALKDKVPPEAFADEDRELEGTRADVAALAAALDKGDAGSARAAALAAKVRAVALTSAYREARARWEAGHPKARRGKAARPKAR